ncbi:non-structural maintenance of chromosomes element 1 [Alternaria panax]|uniref:Non-structural maintenance of chromosomes element 1 homolog n=1 Tax=Alternaria panax TaxID=48097 RepID=A0AAD4ICB7_9PLEO|nr:non-structural maintenance of chromosomes element 1 [Alternaria panax]
MSREESPFVRAPTEGEGYNSIHRAFLQAFQTHSVLTMGQMKAILAHVMTAYNPERPWTEGDVTQPYITSTIQTINAKIEAFDYEIRSTRDQRSQDSVYALVNNASDAVTQLATAFSANEIAYIRRILDHMFEANNTKLREIMAIKHTEASQLARLSRRNRQSQAASRQSQVNGDIEDSQASADTSISIAEADLVLETLVKEAFFQKSTAGYYSLAPRGLMELRAYLKETYNESADENEDGRRVIRIRDCEGCREIVTFGIRCSNRECSVRWHDACANNYYKGRKGNSKCPRCQTECSRDAFVGERAAWAGGRSSMGGVRRSTQTRDDEEDDDEGDD